MTWCKVHKWEQNHPECVDCIAARLERGITQDTSALGMGMTSDEKIIQDLSERIEELEEKLAAAREALEKFVSTGMHVLHVCRPDGCECGLTQARAALKAINAK